MGTVKRPVTVWTALLQCECGGKMYHRKWAKCQDITVWGYECVSHSAERKSKTDKDDPSTRKCENRFIAERMLYTMANVIFASYFQYPENRKEFVALALEKEIKLKQFFVDPDIIFGPFFICDCRGKNFDSLNAEQLDRYGHMFECPEHYVKVNGEIHAVPL